LALSAYSRAEIAELLDGHPDQPHLAKWITDARRQLQCNAAIWGSSRIAEADRLGVTDAELDRLVAQYNALGLGVVRASGDRLVFVAR
jgi:hypothetical protein